jgi:hypothetical protein
MKDNEMGRIKAELVHESGKIDSRPFYSLRIEYDGYAYVLRLSKSQYEDLDTNWDDGAKGLLQRIVNKVNF